MAITSNEGTRESIELAAKRLVWILFVCCIWFILVVNKYWCGISSVDFYFHLESIFVCVAIYQIGVYYYTVEIKKLSLVYKFLKSVFSQDGQNLLELVLPLPDMLDPTQELEK